MKDARLHVRADGELLEKVRRIADRQGVTVSFLVNQFFRRLVDEEERPKADEELGVEQA